MRFGRLGISGKPGTGEGAEANSCGRRGGSAFSRAVAIVLSTALCIFGLPIVAIASSGTLLVSIPDGLSDGTYEGDATVEPDEDEQFDEYGIEVSVVMSDGAIESVTVEGASGQDEQYSRLAKQGIVGQLTGQTSGEVEVDVVSTATCSSIAIVEAVNEALLSDPVDTDLEAVSMSVGSAIYGKSGTSFTVTVENVAEGVDYSQVELYYLDGSSRVYLDEADYSVELQSETDSSAVYVVTILQGSDANSIGLVVYVVSGGSYAGRAAISSSATVSIEDNALVLSGGNGETLEDYLACIDTICLGYWNSSGRYVEASYAVSDDGSGTTGYTADDFFDSDGSIDWDCAAYVLGFSGEYELTIEAGGFEDASGTIGNVVMTRSFVEIAGTNRYLTMAAIVAAAFDGETSEYAVVASGANFPDALAAASLAGALDAPVVLTATNDATAAVEVLLQLETSYVYVVGGTSAVSDAVVSSIENQTGATVERVYGSNRQLTAIRIAEKTLEISTADGGEASTTAIVAAGASFPDALSASPYSYWSASPIYLAKSDGSISDEVLEAIEAGGYTHVVVIGGKSAVSSSAYMKLRALDGVSVERVSGTTRYETSTAMAEWSVAEGMSYDGAAVATGTNFPDALAAATLCGRGGSVLLLASGTTVAGLDALSENASSIWTIYFIGGTSAVSNVTRSTVKSVF